MSNLMEWSDLPEELVDVIANLLFSNVELLRLRNICKSWRSAIATKKRFPNRNRRRNLSPCKGKTCALSPAAFFRVILSSYPNKGWLIKTQDVSEFTQKKLISPLSRHLIYPSHKTLDLLKFTVSEIHKSYDVTCLDNNDYTIKTYDFARVILVENLVFVVDYDKQIWWCVSGEETDNVWTRIQDEEAKLFYDIILHKGQLYALDLKGAIWWISLSELNIFQYGPSTPMGFYDIDSCKDKRLVVHCGDLCVIHRFCERVCVRRVDIERTVGFKVYKMDVETVSWVEVKSLGDEAFVMATDSCFSLLAREYHGCLENSIYFTDEEEKDSVKVFNLGDGGITKKVDSFSSFSDVYSSFCSVRIFSTRLV